MYSIYYTTSMVPFKLIIKHTLQTLKIIKNYFRNSKGKKYCQMVSRFIKNFKLRIYKNIVFIETNIYFGNYV